MSLENGHRYTQALQEKKPLILNLTNSVTMDFVANSLLSVGASPFMLNAREEFAQIIKGASAVYINLGTLSTPFIEDCLYASGLAKQYGKPLVLDPVGAGATKLRTETAQKFVENATIIKGNASEILALQNVLAGSISKVPKKESQGVDSLHTTHEAMDCARSLARLYQNTVVITGKTDFITKGDRAHTLTGGHELMTRVTGFGCALGGVMAGFSSVFEDSFKAAYVSCALFKSAGKKVGDLANGPASFKMSFIDFLYKNVSFDLQEKGAFHAI